MTKSTITREQRINEVKELIANAEEWAGYYEHPIHDKPQREMFEGMARVMAEHLAALTAMDSEPVAWTWHYREQWHVTNDERRAEFVAKDGDVAVLPLYRHAQPAPEYPETLPCPVLLEPGLRFGKGIKTSTMLSALARRAVHESDMAALSPEERVEFQARIEDFKALIAQPAPVVPDSYVMVPMRLTAENGAKGALSGEFSETKFVNCPECFGDEECETCDGSGKIEITVPVTWTTIKAIWAKGVEHFTATPREVKGE